MAQEGGYVRTVFDGGPNDGLPFHNKNCKIIAKSEQIDDDDPDILYELGRGSTSGEPLLSKKRNPTFGVWGDTADFEGWSKQ